MGQWPLLDPLGCPRPPGRWDLLGRWDPAPPWVRLPLWVRSGCCSHLPGRWDLLARLDQVSPMDRWRLWDRSYRLHPPDRWDLSVRALLWGRLGQRVPSGRWVPGRYNRERSPLEMGWNHSTCTAHAHPAPKCLTPSPIHNPAVLYSSARLSQPMPLPVLLCSHAKNTQRPLPLAGAFALCNDQYSRFFSVLGSNR